MRINWGHISYLIFFYDNNSPNLSNNSFRSLFCINSRYGSMAKAIIVTSVNVRQGSKDKSSLARFIWVWMEWINLFVMFILLLFAWYESKKIVSFKASNWSLILWRTWVLFIVILDLFLNSPSLILVVSLTYNNTNSQIFSQPSYDILWTRW